MRDVHCHSMAACVENTSLFLVVNMPKVKLEVIAETEEGDETSLLSSVPDKGHNNANGGRARYDNDVSNGSAVKVRNKRTPRKCRKLPNLSFSPSPGDSTKEEKVQKDQPVRRVITSPKALSSTHGDHSVTPSDLTEDKTLPSNTIQSSKGRVSFQKKKQLFERGEGALLARRALTRRLPNQRNGRRRLPKVPDQWMDPIDRVIEANRVQTLKFDLDESENNTSGISSFDSSSETVGNKDFQRDQSDDSNEPFILSEHEQKSKEAKNVEPDKSSETSDKEDKDIEKSADLLKIKFHSPHSDISTYTSVEVPVSVLSNNSKIINEYREESLEKQVGDYKEDNFPDDGGQIIKSDSEISQQTQHINGEPHLNPCNNSDPLRSLFEVDAHNLSRVYSEEVVSDYSRIGDDLGEGVVERNDTNHIRRNVQVDKEENTKPIQQLGNILGDLNTENIPISDKEDDASVGDAEYPSGKSDLADYQTMDPEVDPDSQITPKTDSELVESPRGDKQLFQLLLDDYEDDFHTDEEEESKSEEQESSEQKNVNRKSEIDDTVQMEEHFQTKLVRDNAIDGDDTVMTAESSSRDEIKTTQSESNEINEESKMNISVNREQLGLHSYKDTAATPESEMAFNSMSEGVDEKDEFKESHSMQQGEVVTCRSDRFSTPDPNLNYEDLSVNNDQKSLLGSQEMVGGNKLNIGEKYVNKNTFSKVRDENLPSMSTFQPNQSNGNAGLGEQTVSENTEISHSRKPDIIVHSEPLPTGENSAVQRFQSNFSRSGLKMNSDEKVVQSSNLVMISTDEKDTVDNGGGSLTRQEDTDNQSTVSKEENETHLIISSQATPRNPEIEANIIEKEQESEGLLPPSEQTFKSIKSLENHERQLGDDISDTQDGIKNKTVITSANPKSSLIQEPLLSQKLIKGSEREVVEGEDRTIREQTFERQMGKQQNNQRKKSDEDLSHSSPGDDDRQTRNMTPLVNGQQQVKRNNTKEENNHQDVMINHGSKNDTRKYEGLHEMEEQENNSGTKMQPSTNGKVISQSLQRGMSSSQINNNSAGHGISPQKVSENDLDFKLSKMATPENVTQEHPNHENLAHNEVVGDIRNHQAENDRKAENWLEDKKPSKGEDKTGLGILIHGDQMSKEGSHLNISSSEPKELVPHKSALKVRQAPTGNDNLQNSEEASNFDIFNDGPKPTNDISDTNENVHELSKNSSLSGGPVDSSTLKENVNRAGHKEVKATESLPKKSALKVGEMQADQDHHQNTEVMSTNENSLIARSTNGNMQEPSQYSNISDQLEEKTFIKNTHSENGQRQPIKSNESVPRKSSLKVRQVPTVIQSSEEMMNHATANESTIETQYNINDARVIGQESSKDSNITAGPEQKSTGVTNENVQSDSENSPQVSKAGMKIYRVRQDQAGMKVLKGGGAFSQPHRPYPNVEQKERPTANGSNRHEGHNCPRELRRLAKLREAEEQAGAESQNQSPHLAPNETGQTVDGTAVASDNLPITSSRQTFPGQGSKEAANSELIQTPASPSSKKRRRKKPADPFDGLPPIKPWHIHQLEMNAEIMERPKKKKKGQRRFNISQFDDPFHQMLWVLFRAADRDNNNKLNKKELSSIFNSQKLQLSLTQDDIKRLLVESSTEEEADPKTCELSFEEFMPLGRLILMNYYSKIDDSSQSKWCILDKGQEYGIIYFNKLTGDASMSVPSDYYADILHEPDLLDIAIHDLFEDADLNEDGKIKLTDFLRILRSEDFGLFLTNGDAEEITKYFVNIRGKEMMVQFDEFLPLAKRLILTVYRARDPTPHEWCHLYTRNVGSFWFNKRTGQTDRHPPTSLVRTLQDLLEHRSREIEVFMEVAEDLHHTKEALQKETEKRQELEANLAELGKQHETTTKELAKTVTNLEKSNEEVEQKSKQIRFFEKEKVKQQNLIESLQDRAEEADRIEANLESLRNVLQNTQTSVREKEFDVRDLTNNLEETRKELANTKQHAANLQDKIDDLVAQLRDEIRRNERVEKELERTKSYKFEKVEVEDILKETKDELTMRMNQLTHARYEIRDNKSHIRRIETELNNVPDLKTQLEEKDKEIKTLKEKIEKMEAQMIEDARLAEKYPRELVRRRRWNKARSIETPDKSHDCSDPNCPVNGRKSASSSPMWAYRNNEETQTHPNGSFLELLSNIEGEDGNDSLNIYDFYEPHYPEVSPHRVRMDSASSPHNRERSRLMRPKSSAGRLETKKQSKLGRGVFLYEEDYILARFLKEGDRVRIKKNGVNILGMKPSDLRTATVRYVGQLDEEGAEHMLFVGLHMDDAVGNTNGIIDDKRYFYSKRRHGKMVRITEVLYLLNPKTTSFDKVSDLVEEYKASRRKRWREYPEEGPRLIRVT